VAAQEAAAPETDIRTLRALCDRGWRIHPCRPADALSQPKAPYLPHGHNDASADYDTVADWWQRWPDALIGYVPASGGHVVLDLNAGVDITDLPAEWQESRLVRSVSGGLHVYFAAQPGVRYGNGKRPDLPADVRDLVDVIRHADGYVIIPPSPGYRLINDREPIPAPDYLAAPNTSAGVLRTPHQLDDRDVIPAGEQEAAVKDRAFQLARYLPERARQAAVDDPGRPRQGARRV
jgi:hypothetical protein